MLDDLARGTLRELRIPGLTLERPTYLMRMQNVRATPLVQAFEAFLIGHMPRTA